MAKLKAPFFSMAAAGTVGQALTVSKHRRVHVAKKVPTHPDAQTDAQLAQRQLYGEAVEAWRALTPDEREALRPAAALVQLPIYQYFMRMYMMALVAHHETHELGGTDVISVAGLSGELADLQKPKDHSHQSPGDGAGGKLDHGLALTGLDDDDHPHYLNEARHDTTDRHTLGTVVPHDALADLTEKAHGSLTCVGPSDHHARYIDAEAVDAMGAKADDNPLHHDRYAHPTTGTCPQDPKAHTHVTVVVKSADETVSNSDVLQDDNELLFAVGANELWSIRYFLRQNSSALADLRLALSLPTGASASGLTYEMTLNVIHSADMTAAWKQDGKAYDSVVVVEALVVVGGTAGNVQLRWAQWTAEASDTKVLQNSHLIARKLA